MSNELEKIDQYGQELEQVADMMVRGEFNATNIARALDLPRAKVVEYMQAWRQIAQNDKGLKARVREHLTEMDRHYSLIVKEFWNLYEDPDASVSVRNQILKNAADTEARRQDTLQKAGLYDDAGITDDLVEMQEKAEAIKRLLGEVTKKYPQTQQFIMEGLRQIFNEPPTVEGEVIV